MGEDNLARFAWRPMVTADLPAIHDLSRRAHPNFPERPEVLAEKLRLFPRGCFVLSDAGMHAGGYCFSHPWSEGSPPALDTMLHLPDAATTYFLHDLTVDASLRGRQLASTIVPLLVEVARTIQLRSMTLVSVSGSERFWTRMGFRRTPEAALQDAVRARYGADAVHMQREIA